MAKTVFKNGEDIQSFCVAQDIRLVNYFVCDLLGGLRTMEESVERTKSIVEKGFGVDGSSIMGYAQIERSDVQLIPDIDTFHVVEHGGEKHAAMFCNVIDPATGKAHPGDPRGILARQIEKAKNLGYTVEMMSELEFFVLNKDRTPADKGSYMSLPPMDGCLMYRHQLSNMMEQAGHVVKRGHHENGPGQLEIELDLTPAAKNADNTLEGIWFTHLIAHSHDWLASYSPKPLAEEAGSGMHEHILLRCVVTGENMMIGEEEGRLSPSAMHFIAGMLKYAPDITAVFGRSDETYARLKPGHEAPTLIGWDFMNRSALVRVPYQPKGSDKTRVEFRAGDASGSVHLMCSMILGAGLKGIEEKLEYVKPCKCNLDKLNDDDIERLGIKRLPSSMTEGHDIMRQSKLCAEVLGAHALSFLVGFKEPGRTHDPIEDCLTNH